MVSKTKMFLNLGLVQDLFTSILQIHGLGSFGYLNALVML